MTVVGIDEKLSRQKLTRLKLTRKKFTDNREKVKSSPVKCMSAIYWTFESEYVQKRGKKVTGKVVV